MQDFITKNAVSYLKNLINVMEAKPHERKLLSNFVPYLYLILNLLHLLWLLQ